MDDWRQKERGTRGISARNTVNVFVSEEKKLSGAICLRLRIYATHRAPLWCSRRADAACLTNGGMIRPAGCRFLVDGAMSQRMAVSEVYLLYYIGTPGGNITRGGTNQIPQVRADSGVNTVQTAGVSGTGANLCQSPKNKQEEGYMRKPTSKKLTCLLCRFCMLSVPHRRL